MAKNPVILTTPQLTLDTDIVLVGSSTCLLDTEDGEQIDKFKEVVRFNRAPTQNFEKFVGEKTTVRVVNPPVFACHKWDDKRWDGGKQDQFFVQKQENCKVVCVGPQGGKFLFNLNVGNVHKTSTAHNVIYNKIPWINGKQPTVGFAFLLLLLNSGFKPTLYGFFGEPGKEGNKALTHYWENRNNISIHHDYSSERTILSKLHEEEKINWINFNDQRNS